MKHLIRVEQTDGACNRCGRYIKNVAWVDDGYGVQPFGLDCVEKIMASGEDISGLTPKQLKDEVKAARELSRVKKLALDDDPYFAWSKPNWDGSARVYYYRDGQKSVWVGLEEQNKTGFRKEIFKIVKEHDYNAVQS